MDINRNNLDKASSPYLRQHADNPVHWQEWSEEILDHARKNDKLVMVSVGYSTCHWCHVMANEAFSDREVADYLNEKFVSIKIDREQRPDIDQYMMDFLVRQIGHGGWPLNVFLSPDQKPLLGVTYVPVEPKEGMPAFIEVLKSLVDFREKNPEVSFDYSPLSVPRQAVPEDELLKVLHSSYDGTSSGYGIGQKFPQPTTLLFLLHWFDYSQSPIAKDMIEGHLDVMAQRGLHDHLQGGFYRYTIDRAWTIPHFEKMLSDQAMLLWAYSAGYRTSGKAEYKDVADKLINCLDETFADDDGLYYSAHDADTDHVEGATYVWTQDEIREALTPEESREFTEAYDIRAEGNFEGRNHLIKIKDRDIRTVERKLLEVRNKRPQPFTDRKIVTSWNALTGIGLVMAYRYAAREDALDQANHLFKQLIEKHYIDGIMHHSSLDGELQSGEFLEDYASVLLLATFLYEETGKYGDLMEALAGRLNEFHDGIWFEADNPDFRKVAARDFDQPVPSSVSTAEYALLRMEILLDREYSKMEFSSPHNNDFHNLAVMTANGRFHVIHAPEKIDWSKLPLNTVQIKASGIQDCYAMRCREYETVDTMLKAIGENPET